MAKKKTTVKPKLHKELQGFEITVNEFGEIISNLPIERLNQFLDDKVQDKKLKDKSADQAE